jgi:hypothetical protein
MLHTALSGGLHERPDAECLELAQDIRVVLYEMADKLGQAIREDAELKGAVSRLLKRGAGKP